MGCRVARANLESAEMRVLPFVPLFPLLARMRRKERVDHRNILFVAFVVAVKRRCLWPDFTGV
jgi:hypothetical protein